MTPAQLSALLIELLALPHETEWVEWKHNNSDPETIGQNISALANSAALHRRETAYIVWGIEDGTKKIVGTTFKPRQTKKGNEELENWLMHSLHPQVNFKMHEWEHEGRRLVLFEIPRATIAPVRFQSEEFIRVGSYTKKLKDFPAKEKELWASFDKNPFEGGIARENLAGDEVLALLDYSACFDLLKVPLPTDQKGILARLAEEKLIVPKPGSRFDVTNLGAILFAKNLGSFDRLARKALRIIKYRTSGARKPNGNGGTPRRRRATPSPSSRRWRSSTRNCRRTNPWARRSAVKFGCSPRRPSVNWSPTP